MSTLSKIFYTVVVIPLVLYILPIVFGFFGVESRVYFIYVMWFIALLVLNIILPDHIPNIFAGEI